MRTRTVGAKTVTEVLVTQDNYNVTGEYLDHAGQGQDESGRIAVEFTFNSQGGKLFGMLTGENKPDPVSGFQRRLGIILDGKLYSAPGLKGQIFDRGIIEGTFHQGAGGPTDRSAQCRRIARHFEQGADKQALLRPDPGKDTIYKSTVSLVVAMVIVPLFMLWYYRFPGLIADIALAINIIVLLAIMIAAEGGVYLLARFCGLCLDGGHGRGQQRAGF